MSKYTTLPKTKKSSSGKKGYRKNRGRPGKAKEGGPKPTKARKKPPKRKGNSNYTPVKKTITITVYRNTSKPPKPI